MVAEKLIFFFSFSVPWSAVADFATAIFPFYSLFPPVISVFTAHLLAADTRAREGHFPPLGLDYMVRRNGLPHNDSNHWAARDTRTKCRRGNLFYFLGRR